jgi:hypothetical protein
LWERYSRLSPGRKFMLAVFMIWLAQALPKWTAAITADGEMSAQIMKIFIAPRAETIAAQRQLEQPLPPQQPLLADNSGQV